MTISIVTWDVRHGDTILPATGGNFSVDEINVPAVSGTWIVPDVPGLMDQLDPRTTTPPRIQITGRRTFWDSLTVAEFSAKISEGWYPNLVPDWDFEGNELFYRSGPVTVSPSTTTVHTGARAYTLTIDPSPTVEAIFGREIGPVTPGEYIGFRAFKYVESDVGFIAALFGFYDENDALVSSPYGSLESSGAEWDRIGATTQVPEGAASAHVFLLLSGSDTALTAPVAGGIVHTDTWTAVRGASSHDEASAFMDAPTFPGPGYPLVSDLTTAWSGWIVDDVTHYAADQLNEPEFDATPGEWPSQEMTLSLHVREIVRDQLRATLAITAATDEALLTDWSPISQAEVDDINTLIPDSGQTVGAVVAAVLSRTIGTQLTASSYDRDPIPDPVRMSLGMTAWDLVRAALDIAGDKLRPTLDGAGLFINRPTNGDPNTPHPSGLSLGHVVASTERVTRSGDWYDSTALISQDENGLDVVVGDSLGPVHTRTYRERFPQGYPISQFQAESITERSQYRGRQPEISVPITMGTWIGDIVTFRTGPELFSAGWQVAAVSYDLQSDIMHLVLRPDPTDPPE